MYPEETPDHDAQKCIKGVKGMVGIQENPAVCRVLSSGGILLQCLVSDPTPPRG